MSWGDADPPEGAEGSLAAWLERVHGEDRGRVGDELAAAARERRPLRTELRIVRPDGALRWLELLALPERGPDGAPPGLRGMAADVTERREAELALREREQRLRAIFSNVDQGYCLCEIVLDATGRPVDYRWLEVNPVFGRMTGLSDVIGRTALELLPDLERHWVEIYGRVALEGETLRFERGSEVMGRWFEVFAMPVEPRGRFALIFKDVTRRKRGEDALRRSEAHFRMTADALPGLLFIATPEEGNVYVNQHYCEYTGRDGEELLGGRFLEVVHDDDRESLMAAWQRGQRSGVHLEEEFRIRRRDGEWRWQRMRALPLPASDDSPDRWVGFAFDVHDRRMLEEELRRFNQHLELLVAERTRALTDAARELQAEMRRREETQAALFQSQKLEALGQLTGGISHDFNNVLAAIQGACRLLKRRVQGDPEADALVGIASRSAEKGIRLISQLMAFARKEELHAALVELPALVSSLGEMVCKVLTSRVRCELDVAPDVWPVLVDTVRLETALLNLATNARDAMPDGGTVTISARNARPGDLPAELDPGREWVRLAVSDTGTGMDEATLRRATEPFFTTKERGKGTGLGLAMAHGFAVHSGGTLRIHSAPGAGTTVEIFLPRASVLPAGAQAPDAAGATPAARGDHGAAKVLLVEDDEAVRPVAARVLRGLGYEVLEAQSAESAEAIAHAEQGIDLLVTDLRMAGASGDVLASRLRSERPALPVLFITGQNGSGVPHDAPVLRKPFTDAALGDAVLRLLGRVA